MKKFNKMAFIAGMCAAFALAGCATCPHPDSSGWEDVFNKDLSNADMPAGTWKYDADGSLVSTTGDTILSKKDYGSVVVDLVYVMGKGANSGLFLYDTEHPKKKFEVQIMDDRSPVFADVKPYQRTGSVYGRCPAREVMSRPAGEENRMTVWCEGDHVRVVVNGREVVDTYISTYVNAEVNPDGTPIPPYHKGFPALATIPRHGRIGLQGIHNTEAAVHFKYLKVKEIK